MDKIEVTQADYDAAQAFFRDDRTGLAVKFQLGAEPQPLLEAFARHRLATRTDVAALVEAAKAMDEDHMTSERHHPGYVLVPTVAFEKMRALVEHGQ
jgi:hypothetical protein